MSTQEGGIEGLDRTLRHTFGWYTVSKKEFKDAIRSKGLWILGAFFTLVFVLPVARVWWVNAAEGSGRLAQLVQQQGMQALLSQVYLNRVTILLPIIAIFVGYAAISKERTSGSLKLLLSLPNSRRDVIVGKVIGRCAVLGVPLVASLAFTAVFLVLSNITFKPELFGLFGLFSVLYALVFVAITVSISGAFSKSSYSGIANFVVYMYTTFAWNLSVNSFADVLTNGISIGSVDTGPLIGGAIRWHIVLFLKIANPNQAYKTLVNSMLNTGDAPQLSARLGMFGPGADTRTVCTDVLNGNVETVQTIFGEQVTCQAGSGSVPFYFSDPVVFVAMISWFAIAAALSYYTFNTVDL
ncbi:ABC transporter permease subunit [Haloarcula onubensis]|uniref:ABC transporter permease n=1 Tax=Haloarcula onubensis TaxID=2950539 RepID=A0ABU2FMW5_9EURY|nr:ABC transporter permease subunit [Halomicroarcula sp. S3CR25-11]MDS0282102.1 ABC transporter permease [Halomicroarcula sp. S3CR25-11]